MWSVVNNLLVMSLLLLNLLAQFGLRHVAKGNRAGQNINRVKAASRPELAHEQPAHQDHQSLSSR